MKTMHWMIPCLLLLILTAGVACDKSSTPPQLPETTTTNQPQAAPRPPLLSKDPEYWTFRSPSLECPPPMSEEFLKAYSSGWVTKDNEIDDQIKQISDPELKKAQREKLWTEVNLQPFRNEADKAYQAASKEYQIKRGAFFESHMDQWFDIAQYSNYTTYDQNVEFNQTPESPYIVENLKIRIEIPVIDSIFKKFQTAELSNISAVADAKWQEITSRVNPYEFYAGLPSSEISQLVNKEKKKIWDDSELELRRSRLMLVGQGNVNNKNIQRLAFMNQLNGELLYEFPQQSISAVTALLR